MTARTLAITDRRSAGNSARYCATVVALLCMSPVKLATVSFRRNTGMKISVGDVLRPVTQARDSLVSFGKGDTPSSWLAATDAIERLIQWGVGIHQYRALAGARRGPRHFDPGFEIRRAFQYV